MIRLKNIYIKHIQNTPAFFVTRGSTQSVNNATYTKVEFDTEVFDSDSAFNHSSTNRFTPGVAGKYAVFLQITVDELDDGKRIEARIYKNGSAVSRAAGYPSVSGWNSFPYAGTNGFIVDMDSDDYLEGYAYHNHGSARNVRANSETYFGAFRVAGI